jgi:predicted CXXCH cytochrome family protein
MCPTCHAPASAYQEFLDPLLKSKHAEGATVTINEPYSCITCHVPLHKAGTNPANLMRINGSSPCVEVTDTPTGNDFCYKCHGVGSTLPMGDLTAFESSGHRNIPPPPTGANIVCDTCHESHASRNSRLLKYEGYMVCMQCHTASASNPNEPDIYTRLTLNDGANSKHPLLPQDQVTGARMECQNCHNTHATTKTAPLVDPHNPGLSGAWTGARGDEKTFCFRCHDGQQLPTSQETTPWASAVLARNAATSTVDMQSLYQTSVHGFASQSNSTTATTYLRADMGYGYGDVLECRVCHDPHGTVNRTAMNSDVKSANGSKTASGLLIASAGGGAYDYRFFCSSCHIWDSATHDSFAGTSTVDFPTKCSNCHYFGSPVGGL